MSRLEQDGDDRSSEHNDAGVNYELLHIPDDDTHFSDTIVLRHMLKVDGDIPDALYYGANGNMHFNLRPLTLDVASLRTHLHGGWGTADITNGKPVIEELLYKAGYSLEQKPRIHNVILFAPKHHKNAVESAPPRLATTAVSTLKNKGLVAGEGKFLLINPPSLYDLTVRTIAMLYPPIKGQVISVQCAPEDTEQVVDSLEKMMAKPDFDTWMQETAPTGKLQFPRMQ